MTDGSARPRFSTAKGVLGLPPTFEIALAAVFQDGRQEAVGTIRGRHRRLWSGHQALLRPLMVTSTTRTGSTWLMRVLGEHPGVVVHRRYPYETVPSRYWMHMLKVLSEPPNLFPASARRFFQGESDRIGYNPFLYGPFQHVPDLQRWFGRTLVERQAAFCQEMVDAYYGKVASHQGQDAAVFFAEKHLPDHVPRILWEVYEGSREIFLVRDPRDMVASMVAFNRKRGFPAFGRELVDSDDDWLARLRHGLTRLLMAWRSRSGQACLLRYEDLILDTVPALGRVLDYLGQGWNASSVTQLLERASADTPELAWHRTTGSPRASVGRWRNSLDRRWWPRLDAAFGDVLEELGYG
jgi:hypothetical protein